MLLNINAAKSGNIPALVVVLVGLVCAVQSNQELLPVPCQLSSPTVNTVLCATFVSHSLGNWQGLTLMMRDDRGILFNDLT